MIFAVAMTFIDQTIVSIAAPTIQHALGLSSSGMQWAINAYLLTLAALFAFGGRLADIAGHRRMVVLGVIIFAGASALCGATPRGAAAETWLVAFRARDQPGVPVFLRRGHRNHPDRPQLRRQPRLRHPGHPADHPVPVRDHRLPHQPGPVRPGRLCAGGQDRPAAGRQRERHRDPAVHPRQLRHRHPRRALRHVRDHGRRRVHRAARAQARRPGRHDSSRSRAQRRVARRGPGHRSRPGLALGQQGRRT